MFKDAPLSAPKEELMHIQNLKNKLFRSLAGKSDSDSNCSFEDTESKRYVRKPATVHNAENSNLFMRTVANYKMKKDFNATRAKSNAKLVSKKDLFNEIKSRKPEGRPRTFVMKMTNRIGKDERKDPMIITDLNMIKESKHSNLFFE